MSSMKGPGSPNKQQTSSTTGSGVNHVGGFYDLVLPEDWGQIRIFAEQRPSLVDHFKMAFRVGQKASGVRSQNGGPDGLITVQCHDDSSTREGPDSGSGETESTRLRFAQYRVKPDSDQSGQTK